MIISYIEVKVEMTFDKLKQKLKLLKAEISYNDKHNKLNLKFIKAKY